MSSDVVRHFGKVSELWWRTMAVPGFEPLEPFEMALEKEKAENEQMKKSLEAMKPMMEKVNETTDVVKETVDTLKRTVGTMYNKICGMEGQLAEPKNRAKQASHDLADVRENQQNANHNLRSCSEGVNTLIDLRLFGKAWIE
jgi:chromosome segregation ATPase